MPLLLLLSSVSILLIDHPTPVTSVLWPLKCVPVFSQCHPIRALHSSLGLRVIINWVESRLPLPCWEGPRLLKIGHSDYGTRKGGYEAALCRGDCIMIQSNTPLRTLQAYLMWINKVTSFLIHQVRKNGINITSSACFMACLWFKNKWGNAQEMMWHPSTHLITLCFLAY